MHTLPLAFCLSVAMGLSSGASAQDKPPTTPVARALSEAQRQAFQAAEADLAGKAAPLALKIGTVVKEIDDNILADKPDVERERKLVNEVTQMIAEAIHLRIAVAREMLRALTPEQKNLLAVELQKPNANPDLVELMKAVFAEKRK